MASYDSPQGSRRHVDDPRRYRVRISRVGAAPHGVHMPSPLTVYISATSPMQARLQAQAAYSGYTVTDVMED